MNEKRKNILNYITLKLNNKYKFKVINNLFGKDLFNYIKKSKIVLNISFYNNAILECYRLNEIQSCKKLVISFYPNKNDIENFNYYKDSVVFVKSINEMIENINFYLNNKNNYEEKINNIKFLKSTKFINDLL